MTIFITDIVIIFINLVFLFFYIFSGADPSTIVDVEKFVEYDNEDLEEKCTAMGASILRRIREESEAIFGPEPVLSDETAQQMLIGVSI